MFSENLTRSSNTDTLTLAQFVHATLECEVALPERAVGRTARHRAEQERRDLDHLLHRTTPDVLPHTCATIHGNDHSVLENKTERRRSVVEFDGRVQRALVRRAHVRRLRRDDGHERK